MPNIVDKDFSLTTFLEQLENNENRAEIILKGSKWNDHVTKANPGCLFNFEVNGGLSEKKKDMIQYFFDNTETIYQKCFDYWKLNFIYLAKTSYFYYENKKDKEWVDSLTKVTDELVEQSFALWDIVIMSNTILLRINSRFHMETVEMKIKENKVISFEEL